MKKTEEQAKKKGMYLVVTFGAVTLIALGALAVGMTNQKKGTGPIDLNATPTPGMQGQAEVARVDEEKQVSPLPTTVPMEEKTGSDTRNPGTTQQTTQTPDSMQTADTGSEAGVPDENVPVLNPEGVIQGLNFSAETGMLWPITGEALISFSPDHAIYHKTLDSYRTSNYVMLAGAVGTHVSAAADGLVTSVKEDLKTGTTVTMRVSEDHEIVYGMLSDVTVKEGELVDAGTVFATVAEPTRYFAEDGTGIIVQVLEKEEPVNPMLFLQ